MSAGAHPLSDLVHDSRIETYVTGKITKHILYESGQLPNERQKSRVERWEREYVLGRGAYGTVYRERRSQGGVTCALRAVKEISKTAHAGETMDYERELEAIAKFSHANYSHCFVRSEGWFESGDSIFITMEYMKHGDLQKLLKQHLTEPEATDIAGQLLEGLNFMHSSGFVHRDLKPSNIMVVTQGPDWFVKIADFGISKRRHEGVTTLHTLQRGTLGFAAPEVLGFNKTGGPADSYTFAVDMWSLGAVIYYILTLRLVFENAADIFKYAMGMIEFPESPAQWEKLSASGQTFVKSLFAPDPGQRPTAAAAATHLWLGPMLNMSAAVTDDGIGASLQSHGAGVDMTGTSSASAVWSEVERPAPAAKRATQYRPPTVEEVSDEEMFEQEHNGIGISQDTLKPRPETKSLISYEEISSDGALVGEITDHEQVLAPHSTATTSRATTSTIPEFKSPESDLATFGPATPTNSLMKSSPLFPWLSPVTRRRPVRQQATAHRDDSLVEEGSTLHDITLPDSDGNSSWRTDSFSSVQPDDVMSLLETEHWSLETPYILNIVRERVYFSKRTIYFVDEEGRVRLAPDRSSSVTDPNVATICWKSTYWQEPEPPSAPSWILERRAQRTKPAFRICFVCSRHSSGTPLVELCCRHNHCIDCMEWAWRFFATDARLNFPVCCWEPLLPTLLIVPDSGLEDIYKICKADRRFECCGWTFTPEVAERDPETGEWVVYCPRCSEPLCFVCTQHTKSTNHQVHVFGCDDRRHFRFAMADHLARQDPSGGVFFAREYLDPPGVRLRDTRKTGIDANTQLQLNDCSTDEVTRI